MFDSTLLHTFQVVAEEASFTKAALRLNITQSAVSAHVRRLEEQTCLPLLTRSTRSVALTRNGEVLLGYSRAILRLHQDAHRQLSGAARGIHLRIGASDDFMSSWLPSLLRRFQLTHKHVTTEVHVANTGLLLDGMNQGNLDLVLGSRCHGSQKGELLWSEPLVWAYAKRKLPDVSSPLPLALFPEPCPYRDAALAALASASRSWRIAVVSPSVAGLRTAAASAFAVAPLNRSLLTAQLWRLGREAGLPALPSVEFMVFLRPQEVPRELIDLAHEIHRAARHKRQQKRLTL
jgi:DNA-binding transcriptional LysR family regulator